MHQLTEIHIARIQVFAEKSIMAILTIPHSRCLVVIVMFVVAT